jgi:hypothetical protein
MIVNYDFLQLYRVVGFARHVCRNPANTDRGGRQRGKTEAQKIHKDTMAPSPLCVVVLSFARSKFVCVVRYNSNRVEPYTPQEIVAACTGAYSETSDLFRSPPLRNFPSPRFENACLEM